MPPPRRLSAFTSRNYRLYFAGQAISLMGTWMTQTASLWLIYHLNSKAFLLGVLGFASQAPIFFVAPFAGVWIDRVSRHRLLIATQVLSMLQSLALAAFALTGAINAAILIALSLLQGLINAFDMPTRQVIVIEFVESKEHLGNAIALNSSMFNLARLIGPAVAGFVIAKYSAGICYLIDGVSYLAVIAGLFAMRLRERPEPPPTQHPLIELRNGFHYAFGVAPIRALISTVSLISFAGFTYTVLSPVFARDVFHGDARVLGYLMSASGVGALMGALYLSFRTTVRGLGQVITFGGAAMAIGLIGFSFSSRLGVSLACLALVGAGGVLLMASSNTLLQTLVDDSKRGRVMSIYTMAFTGTMPLGNVVMGTIADAIDASFALMLSGIICALVILVFYLRLPQLRRAAARLLAASSAPPLHSIDNKDLDSE